jgi:Abnormal spindle-like microcephaly-assoc'd, ASPM-SPD-2-Hydin
MKRRPRNRIWLAVARATWMAAVLACTVKAAGPVVLAPNRLQFRIVDVGQSGAASSVRVLNSGTQSLTITNISVSGDFSQTNNCGASLAPGAQCAIQIMFRPTAVGARGGTLTVTDGSGTQTATLVGTGGAPTLYVAPNGNDAWSGTLVEPNLNSTDGPLATLDRARRGAIVQ